MLRCLILSLCLVATSQAGETVVYGTRNGVHGKWELYFNGSQPRYWKWIADPPPPPPPAPSKLVYSASSFYSKSFNPAGVYTIHSVFNGTPSVQRNCRRLRMVGYCLHYTCNETECVLSPLTEWQAVSEPTKEPEDDE